MSNRIRTALLVCLFSLIVTPCFAQFQQAYSEEWLRIIVADYNERNWGHLLHRISTSKLDDDVRTEFLDSLSLSSDVKNGLSMLTQSDCASGGCLSVDEARDLSYAFSKINMSWSEFIYHHWDNAALAALGFIGYNGFMYHQELRSAFKVAKYAAVRVIVKRELGDIEGWYIKRKPIETFGKKITNPEFKS